MPRRPLLPSLPASLLVALVAAACRPPAKAPAPAPATPSGSSRPAAARIVSHSRHSGSMALSTDGKTLYVVNPEADSFSVVDTKTRKLEREVLLASAAPSQKAKSGPYTPAVFPRMLALAADGSAVYVSGARSNKLYRVATGTWEVRAVEVGSEPVGVLVSPDGKQVFVTCSQDDTVVRVDASTWTVSARTHVPRKPWALATSADEKQLFVTHLLGPGISRLDLAKLELEATLPLHDVAPGSEPRIAHGQVRGIYDVAERPGSRELWAPHLLLGTDSVGDALTFETISFPALTRVTEAGVTVQTLSTQALDLPGTGGAFADVVSGPHALAFTADGRYALVADTQSEDVLVVDTERDVESSLLRPLPGHQPEGILLSPDGSHAYVDERNSVDVAVLALVREKDSLRLEVDGAPIPRAAQDPMPARLRLGQHLFFSANSDELPLSQNHWMACATCHIEGRTDAVTWKFGEGPRDTPSNAGGMLGTGFLFRTADRNQVQDYWRTINLEQGGHFSPSVPQQKRLLDALADFVNLALPAPIPPTTDAVLAAEGKALFERPDVGCLTCHGGPRYTDSGAGNPRLDLGGPVKLHDVGTCIAEKADGGFADQTHHDVGGHLRAACMFDTPSLTGIADSAPYLHDGSALTLKDALERTRGTMGDINGLDPHQEDALVEYLRSL